MTTCTLNQSKRIFISEYLTSGACDDELFASSLLLEGVTMLQAVLDDCSQISNCEIVTTIDHRIAGQFSFSGKRHLTHSQQEAEERFAHWHSKSIASLSSLPKRTACSHYKKKSQRLPMQNGLVAQQMQSNCVQINFYLQIICCIIIFLPSQPLT